MYTTVEIIKMYYQEVRPLLSASYFVRDERINFFFCILTRLHFNTNELDQVIFFIAEYLGWVLLAMLFTFLFTHTHTKKEGIKNILVVLSAATLAWCLRMLLSIFT